MKHTLHIGEHVHEIWLSRSGERYVLNSEFGSRLIDDAADAIVVADGDTVHIHLDGSAYSLRYQGAVQKYAEEADVDRDYSAKAPMPGTVISIAVAEHERVAAGKTLLLIESMKLETSVKAPRDGTVEHIHVKVGQTFDRDAVLVTLARD